ncbi:MAG: NADH-quinone oxidoreductase subunit NuoN [Arcanobacterium sp.]|nr:NADH-quinone oxidoreductase subunit NuoN [Arcanobacterium sp.]
MNNVEISWLSLLPIAIVLGGGVVGTLLEAFLPRSVRRPVQLGFSLLVLVASLLALVWRWSAISGGEGGLENTPFSFVATQAGFTGVSFIEDAFSVVAQGIILLCAIIAYLVIADRGQTGEGAFAASAATRPGSAEERESTLAKREQTEIYPLVLFAIGGMMAFTAAFDLLSLFISLEVLSLPLYVLSATARRRRLLSQEAAMKYFLLGAFSSAIFLMGAALIYGATGALNYHEIFAVMVPQATGGPVGEPVFFILGVIMLLTGLLFKVGAAPFHAWTPDVYQGAPTPITGFMAAGTKIAAFIAIVRAMVYLANGAFPSVWVYLAIIIVATILVGTVLGLVQTDIKRLLAYSSIAHAGFILIAVQALNMSVMTPEIFAQAIGSIYLYLLVYGIATIGAFAIVTLVREQDASGNVLGEATKLSAWAGLGKRSPFLAVAMLVFLLSFAGIPLTAGFIGKFEVFRAGILSGGTWMVVLAVLASAATAFFYFRLVQLMFLQEPAENTVVIKSEGLTFVAVVLALVLTIAIGVFPDPVVELIRGSFS